MKKAKLTNLILTGCLLASGLLCFTASGWAQLLSEDKLALTGRLDGGLQRFGLQTSCAPGGNASTGMEFRRISDGSGDITIRSFKVDNGRMKLSADFQEVDENFSGFVFLTPAERGSFSREAGMRRFKLAGDFALNPKLQLGTYFARTSDKDAGLVKYGLSLKGEKFSVAANFRDIDPEFDRVADLADPDTCQMLLELGMKRHDLSIHLQPSKSVTIDSSICDATHSTEDRFRQQLTNSISINPSRGPKLSFYRYEMDYGSSASAVGTLNQSLTLNHKAGDLSLSMAQYILGSTSSAGWGYMTETRTFHLNTDPNDRASLTGDWSSVTQSGGQFEDTRTLKLTYKLTPGTGLAVTRSVLETNEFETVTQECEVATKVGGGLGVQAGFGETLVNGDSVGRIFRLGLVPAQPKDFGMFKQTSWSVGLAQIQRSTAAAAQTDALKVSSEVLEHKIEVEYLGALGKNGRESIMRSFSIAGDQNPRRRLHYSLAYKVHDAGAGYSLLTRRYDADWQIGPSAKLTYSYSSCKDVPYGAVPPPDVEQIKLTAPLTKQLNFIGRWDKTATHYLYLDTLRTTSSFGLSGKVSSLGMLEASYGFDRVTASGSETSAHTYKLKYEYRVSEDHFLAFGGAYTDWSGPRPAKQDSLVLRLDFKTLFG